MDVRRHVKNETKKAAGGSCMAETAIRTHGIYSFPPRRTRLPEPEPQGTLL